MIRLFAGFCLVTYLYADSSPAFEVASVKPAGEETRVVGIFTYPGGRVTAFNYTLKMLIHEAYAIEDYNILGGPSWAEADRYNVEAKPPASAPLSRWVPENFKAPPNPEMRRMLQSLLAERFRLKLHMEQKRESIYALAIAKGGPKLSAPRDATQQPFVSFLPHALRGQNATMDMLAQRLGPLVKRPVLNLTALRGNFDFLIDFPPDDATSDSEVKLLRAVQQVGLKLQSKPGMVGVIVIDHAEKPSAN